MLPHCKEAIRHCLSSLSVSFIDKNLKQNSRFKKDRSFYRVVMNNGSKESSLPFGVFTSEGCKKIPFSWMEKKPIGVTLA
jgi:hypothetical protein